MRSTHTAHCSGSEALGREVSGRRAKKCQHVICHNNALKYDGGGGGVMLVAAVLVVNVAHRRRSTSSYVTQEFSVRTASESNTNVAHATDDVWCISIEYTCLPVSPAMYTKQQRNRSGVQSSLLGSNMMLVPNATRWAEFVIYPISSFRALLNSDTWHSWCVNIFVRYVLKR